MAEHCSNCGQRVPTWSETYDREQKFGVALTGGFSVTLIWGIVAVVICQYIPMDVF